MMRKKILSIILSSAMVMGLSVPGFAEEKKDLLEDLQGSYSELFPVICAEKYDQLWLDYCAAYAGEENAEASAEMLKSACVGTIYGQEAIDAYADDPESTVFDCYFLGDVAQFTVEDNQISGVDADGKEVFSHTYSYIGDDETSGFALYQSDDEDSGLFTYFAFAPDTPDTTYHIEFRYGDTLEKIGDFYEGKYAYWLAAGIQSDASDEVIGKVIDLFCKENLTAEE